MKTRLPAPCSIARVFKPVLRRFLSTILGVCLLAWIGDVRLWAGGVVSGCSQQELENAIAGGGMVTFSRDCEITLTNPVRLVLNTRLDAAGYNVTIKSLLNALNSSVTNIAAFTNIISTPTGTNCQTTIGCVTNVFFEVICTTNVACTPSFSFTTNITFTTNVINSTTFTNGVRLFEVASNASVSFTSLRLASGRSTNGGALYIHPGATVLLTNCTLSGNSAIGDNGVSGANGADSSGNGHGGGGGTAGGSGFGGAVYNLGELVMLNCSLSSNTITSGRGGNGGNGGAGRGLGGNGGAAGNGGSAFGGAVYNAGSAFFRDCSFTANRIVAGNGGFGGTNGNGGLGPGVPGNGGAAGVASGAGLYSAQNVTVLNCTFSDNEARGGNSAAGGTRVSGVGYDGARGGASLGGGVCGLGNGTVTNCTFFNNKVIAGNGGNGGPGRSNAGDGGAGGIGSGGGLYSAGNFIVVNCTFSTGSAVGGTNGVAGSGVFPGEDGSPGRALGGNIARGAGNLTLKNSIVATNLSGGGGHGTITDEGNNISADGSLAFGANSRRNTDPLLGPLSDANGGPTKTMSLLPGSPAIDAGDDATALNFDQRGFVRPAGVRSDIGAIEAGAPAITVPPQSQTRNLGTNVSFSVTATGDSPLRYQWKHFGTNVTGATGLNLTINNLTVHHAGPYQAVVSNSFATVTSAVAMLTITTQPVITMQPTNFSVLLGQPGIFRVTATGLAPLHYQWRFNGDSIPGATASVYSRPDAQVTDDGSYTVVITNASGSVTSQPAVLRVLLNPALTQVHGTPTNISFAYQTATGLTYVVEYKNDLNALTWTSLVTNAGTGNILTYLEGVTNGLSRFYRVVAR